MPALPVATGPTTTLWMTLRPTSLTMTPIGLSAVPSLVRLGQLQLSLTLGLYTRHTAAIDTSRRRRAVALDG